MKFFQKRRNGRAQQKGLEEDALRLRLMHEALDIQRARLSEKTQSSNTRASFLLAAAGLVLTSEVIPDRTPPALLPTLALLVVAVLCVIAFRPGQIQEPKVEQLRVETKTRPIVTVEWHVYRQKLKSHDSASARLQTRERLLLWATWLFVAALVYVAFATLLGSLSASPLPSPTPTATMMP